MPKTLTALLAAGVLLLAACGDSDDGEEDAGGQETTSSTIPEQTGEYAEFCERIMTPSGQPPTDVQAPEEIAEDWTTLMNAAEAGQDLDSSNPEDQQRMTELQEELAPAQQRVQQFIMENCNLPNEEQLPSGDETSPTTAAG